MSGMLVLWLASEHDRLAQTIFLHRFVKRQLYNLVLTWSRGWLYPVAVMYLAVSLASVNAHRKPRLTRNSRGRYGAPVAPGTTYLFIGRVSTSHWVECLHVFPSLFKPISSPLHALAQRVDTEALWRRYVHWSCVSLAFPQSFLFLVVGGPLHACPFSK